MDKPTRSLKIDLVDLEEAFEYHDPSLEMNYSLDLETGEVIMISADDRAAIEEVYDLFPDFNPDEADWQEILEEVELPDWQKELLPKIAEVESNADSRYLSIPQSDSHEDYNDMMAFIDTVTDENLKAKLERAVEGKRVFRRFKDTLLDYSVERERWFEYKHRCVLERISDWLESEGIMLEEEG